MSRLAELWEWQRLKKEKAMNSTAVEEASAPKRVKTNKTIRSSAKRSELPVPRYMQLTQAAMQRKTQSSSTTRSKRVNRPPSTKAAATSRSSTSAVSRLNTSANSSSSNVQPAIKPTKSTALSASNRNTRSNKLNKLSEQQTASGHSVPLTDATNIDRPQQPVQESRKIARGRRRIKRASTSMEPRADMAGKLALASSAVSETKPRQTTATSTKQRKRSLSPETEDSANAKTKNTTSKRRRSNSRLPQVQSPVPPATKDEQLTKEVQEPITENTGCNTTDIQNSGSNSKRKNFAPANSEFSFRLSVDSVLTSNSSSSASPALHCSSNSGKSLETILELDDDVFKKPSRTPAAEIRAPLICSSSHRTTPRCHYETLHSIKQQKLSDKLRSATSPEEKIAVLAQSPMIELTRRRPRPTTPGSPALPPLVALNLDEEPIQSTQHVSSSDTGGAAQESQPSTAENQLPASESQLPTPEDQPPTLENTERNVQYYKDLVVTNTELLESLAQKWDEINSNIEDAMEEVKGEMRSTSCQARLIIAERFHQFGQLISQCEFKTGDKPVLVDDLQGFWDMIFFQVEDVLNKFAKLDRMKAANWKLNDESENLKPQTKKPVIKKKKPVKKEAAVSKFAAFRAKMKKQQEQQPKEVIQEEVTQSSSTEVEKPVTPSQHKTYSFRRSTVEAIIDQSPCRMNPPSTPCTDPKLQLVSIRTLSAKKSIRRSVRKSARKSIAHSDGSKPITALSASPDLSAYLPRPSASPAPLIPTSSALPTVIGSPASPLSTANQARRSDCSSMMSPIRHRKSCTPSPITVNAMLSASHCGKSLTPITNDSSPLLQSEKKQTRKSASLRKSVLTRHMTPGDEKSSYSPSSHLKSLQLADQTPNVFSPPTPVNLHSLGPRESINLMAFSPQTPASNQASLVTPRRSARLAKKSFSLI